MSLADILDTYGENGITDLDGAFGLPAGVITDDTQQAMAVAEGLITAMLHNLTSEAVCENVWRELKRWHATQSIPFQSRAPGFTSMEALRKAIPGTLKKRTNSSNSCGSVMRAHPIGIAFANDPTTAFNIGMDVSVLTHGDDQAVTAGGAMASLISSLCAGVLLNEALETMCGLIEGIGIARLPITQRVCSLNADELACGSMKKIGLGWNADDALAMSVFAARRFPDNYHRAVCFAVNHDGDSDSTGSMTGALLGAMHGLDAVTRSWRDRLERRADLNRLAFALAT
jgi:ADP-ribosylglycohydrolase